jgi:hypothetical protein
MPSCLMGVAVGTIIYSQRRRIIPPCLDVLCGPFTTSEQFDSQGLFAFRLVATMSRNAAVVFGVPEIGGEKG